VSHAKDPMLQHIARILLIGVYTRRVQERSSTYAGYPRQTVAGSILKHERSTGTGSGASGRRSASPGPSFTRVCCRTRWRRMDMAQGINHVFHFRSRPVDDIRKARAKVAIEAGQTIKVGDKVGDS
jgi:hypothetical protein